MFSGEDFADKAMVEMKRLPDSDKEKGVASIEVAPLQAGRQAGRQDGRMAG